MNNATTKQVDTLIHARWIITCEDENKVLEHHAMAISQGKIVGIVPQHEAKALYQPRSERHYNDHAVMPGFINSHTHLAMNLLKGLADDLDLMDWLSNHIWPAEAKLVTSEFVLDGSLIAMAEMIRSGTTCFNDMYFYPEATASATEQAGLRGHVGMHIFEIPTRWARTLDECFTKSIEFHEQYKNHPLITPTVATHSTYTVPKDSLIRANQLANDLNLRINIHLLESAAERPQSQNKHGAHPVQALHEIGMLSPRLMAIHMVQLEEADFELLLQTKPNIVHCPESNMKLASGACQVHKLLQLGLNVALGTDGAASNNDLDMIGEMRSAAFLGKLTAHDPKALSADTVLKMATLNGAKTLGIDHLTGSLTIGKAADFIAIDLSQPETQPLYHPVSQIVYATSRNQVTDVWVNGRELMKNRTLLTLDQTELALKSTGWAKKINPFSTHQ